MSIETLIRGADGLATAIGDPASVGGLAATDHGPSVVQSTHVEYGERR